MSGTSLPMAAQVWASALPPSRFLPPERSRNSSTESASLRSGVTFLRMSAMAAYRETTSWRGDLTTSSCTRVAMLRLSLPPSTATPSAVMAAAMASAASRRAAPSPGSLGAHIQLAEHLTWSRSSMRAQTRLVRASPTARRAPAAGSTSIFTGCSPMAVAMPENPKWLCATTATSPTVS